MCYGKPVIVTPEDGRFQPRFEDIVASVGSYTRAIVVNSPNNPSGAVYSEEFIAEIVAFCEKKDIYLIMDDIYHKLIFGKTKWVSPYKYAKQDQDNSRVVVINGVSKAYAMTGFRIGWTVSNRKVAAAMVNVAAQNTSCPSVVLQAAAAGALTGIQTGVEALRLFLENNRNVMLNELKAFTGVKCIPPDGTFYCLPGLPGLFQRFGGALETSPRTGPGGHGSGQGIRLGRSFAAELLRHGEGDTRRCGATEVGA